MDEPKKLCLHCEIRPQETFLRLCKVCASQKGLRIIYKTPSWYNPDWDDHIQNMVEKTKFQIPLGDTPQYGGDPEYATPQHPRQPAKAQHDRMPRVFRVVGNQKNPRKAPTD